MSLRMVSRALVQVADDAGKSAKAIEDSAKKTQEAVKETKEYIQTQDWGTAMFDSMVRNIPRIERLTTDLIEHMRRAMQDNTPRARRGQKTEREQRSSSRTTTSTSASGKGGARFTTTTTATPPSNVNGGEDTINGLASKGKL